MKKIGSLFKETTENLLKNNLKASGGVFVVRYSGLSSPDLTTLRFSLKNSKAAFFVVKNSIARRALRDLRLESLVNKIEGPCGLVFVKEEPQDSSRILYNFSKEHEQLKLEGGVIKDRILDKKDIEHLAKLPPKEVLIAQLVITLKSLMSSLAMVLNQTIRKFIYCLDKIRQKKSN